ncbi:MAG: hypothetical protein ACI9M6_001688 [Hydrogenophaga sp.]|jgi:hypothetical protein
MGNATPAPMLPASVAADLVRLNVSPDLNVTARFGLVTLARRQEAPALCILREQLPLWVGAFSAR